MATEIYATYTGRDYLTKDGAGDLSDIITRFWRFRGYLGIKTDIVCHAPRSRSFPPQS